MRRTDVENPWLSRQGPPSSLLLLSFTKTEGPRDGVTELTSWITSNTPSACRAAEPPTSSLLPSLSHSLPLSFFSPSQGVYLSIFPFRHLRAQTQRRLALSTPLKHRPVWPSSASFYAEAWVTWKSLNTLHAHSCTGCAAKKLIYYEILPRQTDLKHQKIQQEPYKWRKVLHNQEKRKFAVRRGDAVIEWVEALSSRCLCCVEGMAKAASCRGQSVATEPRNKLGIGIGCYLPSRLQLYLPPLFVVP